MSDVKRYFTECGYGCSHGSYEHPEGQWVDYEDYARLKSEVERLRKAGDAVSLILEAYLRCKPYDGPLTRQCLEAWNAAKEGKPSV